MSSGPAYRPSSTATPSPSLGTTAPYTDLPPSAKHPSKPLTRAQVNRKRGALGKSIVAASRPARARLFKPSPHDKPSGPDSPNLAITRLNELVSEVSVRFVSFVEGELTNRAFTTKEIKEIMQQLAAIIQLPLDSYISDMIAHLTEQLTLGGLQVQNSNGSVTPLRPEHRTKIDAWLKSKLQDFHEPYRIV